MLPTLAIAHNVEGERHTMKFVAFNIILLWRVILRLAISELKTRWK